jgi:hypothetical protein
MSPVPHISMYRNRMYWKQISAIKSRSKIIILKITSFKNSEMFALLCNETLAMNIYDSFS